MSLCRNVRKKEQKSDESFRFRPRMFQKVTVVVGNPIKLDLVLEDLRSRGASAEEQRKVITDLVQVKDIATCDDHFTVKAA